MNGGAATAEQRPPPLVSLQSVTKRFPGVLASDAVSLAIRGGEVHVLLGENGAGKSTLVGMLAGLQQPDGGSILAGGRPVCIDSPARALSLGIGTVFQHPMLAPSLTVVDNLLLGGRWWRRPSRALLRGRLADTCAGFGIGIDPDAITGRLSLGEQQQVEIIRALWRGGRVIVLDEPTAMLSPRGIEQLGALMRRMAGQGIGVVFITHALREALDYGDRISVLRQGRLVGEIAPQTLPTLPRPQAADRIIRLMFGAGSPHAVAEGSAGAARGTAPDAPVVLDVRAVGQGDAAGGRALHSISFAVRAGEVFGIAGIDGNGQRELAEILSGQRHGSGTVLLDGQPLAGLGVAARSRRGLRYVSDDRLGEGTVGSLSIGVNLLLKRIGKAPYWRAGLARAGMIDRHAAQLVREHDIRTPSTRTPIGLLSGGNIQKALLARELATGARAVIYSKPTAGLDVRATERTRARILRGAADGIATVLISTDLEEILALSDRIGVLVRGELVGVVERGAASRSVVGRLMAGAGAAATRAA